MSNPNALMIKFERETALGPTFAARLLGLPYITYAQYRNGTRALKATHRYHMEVLMLLGAEALRERIDEVINGL